MKIAFIGGRTFHHPDGIASYMKNLATELAKMGHEPIVFVESDCHKIEYFNGFKVVHQKSLKSAALTKILLGWRSTVFALCKEKGVQVFHYNAWGPALIASKLPLLFGRVSVVQAHGLEFKRTKYTPKQQKMQKIMFDFSARWNKNWTVVSEEQHEYFLKEYGRDSRTITCAVGLPGDTKKSDVLERFGLMPNNYIVYMGRLVQDKNPDYLIKGFLASNHKDKQLVICGDNPQLPDYVQYLKDLAKDCPNVIFTGAVFDADKDTIFRKAWAYCLPSTMEGLPISLLEGMSYGKICIASDIQANKEALGESGIWVRPEKASDITEQLNTLYEHYEDYLWQGVKNKERVIAKFSWDKKAQEYIDYVSSLVNHKRNKC